MLALRRDLCAAPFHQESGVRMNRTIAALAFTTLFAVPFAAQAQFARMESAIEYRKSAMFLMNQHFNRIGAVVKGDKPYDKADVEANAALVETLSKLPWQAFVVGSETGRTKAKPEIWKEQDKFKASADKSNAEIVKLSAAAKAGDLAMIKTAFGNVDQSCKSCHDNYRTK
jgi:cytochrome c556